MLFYIQMLIGKNNSCYAVTNIKFSGNKNVNFCYFFFGRYTRWHLFLFQVVRKTFFCNSRDTLQYHGGLRSRELGRHYHLTRVSMFKLYNSVTVCFLCFAKVCLSHRSKLGNECGLGALQHSLWPDVHSICLAIWTKALWFLCEYMNFHPDKQLF